MNTPMHNARKYHNICQFCNKEFMGKRKNMKVCYENVCQREYQAYRSKVNYEKKKARQDDGA